MKGQSQVENNLDTNSGIGYRSAGKSKRRFRFKTWKQARDYMLPAGNFRVLIEMHPCIYRGPMIPMEPQPPAALVPLQAEQIRTNMRRIAKRQWWLWSSAVMVTLLLTLGIASFEFPGLLSGTEAFYSFQLDLAMRGLVGLVLLFNVYTVYQQLQIHRIQSNLSDQVEALGKMEVRTEEVYKLAVLAPLTGLHNRRSGEQRLAEEISRAQRHGRPLTILLLDLNGLKHLNDKFGHAAGDELIRKFGA